MDELLPRVMTILSTTPGRWIQMANLLPLDMLSMKPAPGEWSAVECLQHLIDTESVFQSRLDAFREGRDFPAFNPDEEGTKLENPSPETLAGEFDRRRAESLIRLEKLTPASYGLRARHAELGPVTLEQMINEWAAHDLNHTVQAERALMQPFLRACGPWQKYFTDHMVQG
jgi:hypothetical protein